MEIKETKEMLSVTFGKNYSSIHLYFLKHLNRYRKVKMDIPAWKGNQWENDGIIKFQELPKDVYFNQEFLEKMGIKNKEDLVKKFTIYYELYNKSFGAFTSKGFFEDRNQAFDFYLEQMEKAKKLQDQLCGVIPKAHNDMEDSN